MKIHIVQPGVAVFPDYVSLTPPPLLQRAESLPSTFNPQLTLWAIPHLASRIPHHEMLFAVFE